MVLTIDAGNTRTKWALFDSNGEICHQGMCLNADIANTHFLPSTFSCQHIMISNVAGPQHAEKLQQRINQYTTNITWCVSNHQANNVINHYTHPELLGSDRWAALIAAWHIHHAPCVVVNAGTATTIDAIISKTMDGETYGEFVGGMILPGISLMQNSLGLATAQLSTASTSTPTRQSSAINPFGITTNEAIYSGAVYATLGAIELMLKAMQAHSPRLVISGGNALSLHEEIIATNSTSTSIYTLKPVLIAKNLVLHGLYLLAQPIIHKTSKSTLS